MRRRATPLIAALAVLGVLAVALPAAAAEQRAKPVRLKAFASCEGLVRFARANALRTGAVGGIATRPAVPLPDQGREEGAGAPGAPMPATGVADDVSGTNLQEAGVDEPDLIKTDGERAFAVAGSALHSVDVRAGAPRRLDTLALPAGDTHELLLHGDRLLVISRTFGGAVATPAPRPDAPVTSDAPLLAPATTVLTEVDVRDPAVLRVVRTVRAEGAYVSARLTGATARVVLTTAPELAATTPAAIRAARRPAAWLPRATVATRRTGRRTTRRLVACSDVRRPQAFSGLTVVSVLTIDMDRGLPWVDADAVMGDAQIVYGSLGSLYVATERWIDPATPVQRLPAASTTQIHRFDAAEDARTAYRASGEVPGHLLNQFSLSEHDGALRVAATETPTWLGGEERESESAVTVLRESGGRLVRVGRVGGLGRGERIFSVRFIDAVGYVVTFRQTDPLYTIDLADPTAPRVAGELKIPGYSAYLHPLGDGLLLGVGQDATDEGMTTGTQLSLFDVSDLARPARLRRLTVPSGFSEAEADHHAFLYWAPSQLAVLPLQVYWEKEGDAFSGAAGFRIDPAAAIAQVGRIEHPAGPEGEAPIRRSLVVGDRLFTLSDSGLLASALADLRPQAWLPLTSP